jgi:hypothetical protein
MTKCEYGKRSKVLDRHPLVECYDDAGMDEGRRMVTLVKGYAFEDAAAPGQDPEARIALHSRGFDTVKDAVDRLRGVSPCHCGRCVGTV